MRTLRFPLIPILLSTILAVFGGAVFAVDLETSVVWLDLNGRKYSESFELLDLGDDILLPLRATAQLLDAVVELDPQAMTAKITRTWDKKIATADLSKQRCYLDGIELVMSPGAQAGAGDFFLPTPAIEKLLDVKVTWDIKNQVLFLAADRSLSVLGAKSSEDKTEAQQAEEAQGIKARAAAPFLSLGSIQYVITKGEASEGLTTSVKDEMNVDAHLQVGGVPVDVSGKAKNFSTEDREWVLERATATYSSPRLEVVLGDTTYNLGRVMQDSTPFRGIRFAAPSGWTTSQLSAVTDIEGWVEAGASVELTINGYYLGRCTADDSGHYIFPRVPLQIVRVNKVEITVIEEDGTRMSESRTITATPRLLSAGSFQSAGGWGYLMPDPEADPTAIIGGGSLYAGVTDWLTAGAEVARRIKLDDDGNELSPADLAGDVGLALRLNDNTVLALDWMVSTDEGESDEMSQGGNLALNMQLGRLGLQGLVFYREPELDLFVKTEPDTKGYQIIAEYEVNQKLDAQANFKQWWLVSAPEAEPKTKIETVLRLRPTNNDSAVLKLQHEEAVSETAELDLRHSTPRSEIKLDTEAVWSLKEDGARERQSAKAELDLSRMLSKSTYVSLGRSDTLRWLALEPTVHQSSTDAQISWYPGRNRIMLSGQVDDIRNLEAPAEPVTQGTATIDLSRAFGPAIAGVAAEWSRYYEDELTDSVVTDSAYITAQRRGTGLAGQIRLDYIRPLVGTAYDETMKATVKGGLALSNGLFLGVEGQAERPRAGAGWGETEYTVGLTLSQGLGFSNGGIRGFRAVGGRPTGYIEGFVYVDSDRDGKRDGKEKTLAGVPIFLAGRRAKTDKDGYYCFQFVSPGTYGLGLDPDTLPADYTPLTETVLIKLQPNANYSQDFAIALNGTIDGTVFLDVDGNGRLDKGEMCPPWVKLMLDGKIESFTDDQGNFSFGNLDLGTHILTVDAKALPAGVMAPSPLTIEITEKSLDVWDVMVPLALSTKK